MLNIERYVREGSGQDLYDYMDFLGFHLMHIDPMYGLNLIEEHEVRQLASYLRSIQESIFLNSFGLKKN